jgi:copper chaperone NosL
MLNRRQALLAPLCLLFSCRSQNTPEDPIWGKQPCAHCRMLVSDPRYAAQALTASGERVYFDDVGCLARELAEHPGALATWVRDAKARWIETSRARFSGGAPTPMDFGFVVDDAGSFDFTAVQAAVVRGPARGSS